jgi:hypothetical protein
MSKSPLFLPGTPMDTSTQYASSLLTLSPVLVLIGGVYPRLQCVPCCAPVSGVYLYQFIYCHRKTFSRLCNHRCVPISGFCYSFSSTLGSLLFVNHRCVPISGCLPIHSTPLTFMFCVFVLFESVPIHQRPTLLAHSKFLRRIRSTS